MNMLKRSLLSVILLWLIVFSIPLMAAEQTPSQPQDKNAVKDNFFIIYLVDATSYSSQSRISDRTYSEKTHQAMGIDNDLIVLFTPVTDFCIGGDFRFREENINCSGASFALTGGLYGINKSFLIGGIGASWQKDEYLQKENKCNAYYFIKGMYCDSYVNLVFVHGANADNDGFEYLHQYDGFLHYYGDYLFADRDIIPICLKGAFDYYSAQLPSSQSSQRGYEIDSIFGYQHIGIIIKDFVLTAGYALLLQSSDWFLYGQDNSNESVYNHYYSGWGATFEISNVFEHIRIAGEFHRVQGDSRTIYISKIKAETVW